MISYSSTMLVPDHDYYEPFCFPSHYSDSSAYLEVGCSVGGFTTFNVSHSACYFQPKAETDPHAQVYIT